VVPPNNPSADTRRRLLDAARVLFARHGYHGTTIAQICAEAEANIAAVNYHFRSKENLYVAAWREALARSLRAHPSDGGVPAEAPPEERLCGRIRALMHRAADPESHEFDIIHKEMANPTGLLAEVARRAITPLREALSAVLAELLGPAASPAHVRLCERSVITQCIHFTLMDRLLRTLPPEVPRPPLPPLDVDIETAVEHVCRFSLAGIRDLRRRIEADQGPAPPSSPRAAGPEGPSDAGPSEPEAEGRPDSGPAERDPGRPEGPAPDDRSGSGPPRPAPDPSPPPAEESPR